jgi:hypothetical protein
MNGTSKGTLLEQLGFLRTDEQIRLSIVCKLTRDLINNLVYIASILLAYFLLFSSILKIEAICSSETSVITISTRPHIPEDCSIDSHRREDLKSYNLYISG